MARCNGAQGRKVVQRSLQSGKIPEKCQEVRWPKGLECHDLDDIELLQLAVQRPLADPRTWAAFRRLPRNSSKTARIVAFSTSAIVIPGR